MDVHTFISNYQETFGVQAELPITFWYSDRSETPTEKVNGYLFRCMELVREGGRASLNAETMGCGGGKFYTGFTEMPEHVPNFVSLKKKYKRTPEMVIDFIREIQVPKVKKDYLHFTRIDRISSFDDVEGILFPAAPDILSGLATWIYYDSNTPDTVSSLFGSGCCSAVTQTILENQKQGRHTFLGFSDPSVRPCFEADILSFAVPTSRFRMMCHTMRESYLFDTHVWGKVKKRIQKSPREEVSSSRPIVSFRVLPGIQLREVRMEDAAAICHAIDTHRDYMHIWLPLVDTLKSTTDEEEFLKSVFSAPDDRREPISDIWNEHDEICELVGFHFSDLADHHMEIGYWFLPGYQHRGIMIQCVRYLYRWAIETEEIKRIQIRCVTGDAASNCTPPRLGFRLEGTERADELLTSGEYTDVHVCSALREGIGASF